MSGIGRYSDFVLSAWMFFVYNRKHRFMAREFDSPKITFEATRKTKFRIPRNICYGLIHMEDTKMIVMRCLVACALHGRFNADRDRL